LSGFAIRKRQLESTETIAFTFLLPISPHQGS
jgi:hypothetical protein